MLWTISTHCQLVSHVQYQNHQFHDNHTFLVWQCFDRQCQMTTKSSPNAKYRHISSVARQPSMGDPQGLMVDLIESLGVLWKKTSTSDYHVPIKVSINQYENLEGYPIYGNFTLPVYGWSSVLRFFFLTWTWAVTWDTRSLRSRFAPGIITSRIWNQLTNGVFKIFSWSSLIFKSRYAEIEESKLQEIDHLESWRILPTWIHLLSMLKPRF